MDMDAFMAFVGKFAVDLGAVVAAGNVVVGDRLGLYRGSPAVNGEELAARTGTDARYVAEWLAGQAAGGYIEYADGRFFLTAEQALALADPAGPVDVAGAFTLALGALTAVPAVTDAFRTGAGVGWHEQADVFTGCERFFRRLATRRISCRTGCPRCPASCPGSHPVAPWRTSAAGSARRRCCSRPRFPPRGSPGPTTTPSRSRWPPSARPTRGSRTG